METPNPHLLEPLIGTEEVTVDSKGRVLVSKKKRDRLGSPFAVGIGVKGCFVAYTRPAWVKLLTQLQSPDAIDLGSDTLRELMLYEADDGIEFDSQGRFVVPLRLRRLLKLEGVPCYLSGLQDKVELWPVSEYEIYQADRRAYTEKFWSEISENKFRVSDGVLRGLP